jgi:hypothetical protein
VGGADLQGQIGEVMINLIKYTSGQHPYCLKCKREVDRYSVELFYGVASTGYQEPKQYYTGHDRMTLHVECHDEVFEKSYYGTFR